MKSKFKSILIMDHNSIFMTQLCYYVTLAAGILHFLLFLFSWISLSSHKKIQLI